MTSLPTVNHNVLPPYQTSSSPKSTSSPSALQLHSNPAGAPQDCIDYSSGNDKSVLGLSSASASSLGSGPLPTGSGSVGAGVPTGVPGTPPGNSSGAAPWKYQSFQVL